MNNVEYISLMTWLYCRQVPRKVTANELPVASPASSRTMPLLPSTQLPLQSLSRESCAPLARPPMHNGGGGESQRPTLMSFSFSKHTKNPDWRAFASPGSATELMSEKMFVHAVVSQSQKISATSLEPASCCLSWIKTFSRRTISPARHLYRCARRMGLRSRSRAAAARPVSCPSCCLLSTMAHHRSRQQVGANIDCSHSIRPTINPSKPVRRSGHPKDHQILGFYFVCI